MTTFLAVLAGIGAIVLTLALSVAIWGGLIWLLCWGLQAIGITSIAGWTVAFSWPLVVVIVIIWTILSLLFRGNSNREG